MPRAGSMSCVALAVCIHYIVVRRHIDVTETTIGSVSAGIVMHFATRVIPCSIIPSIGASGERIVIHLASLLIPSIATGANCTGTILGSMQNILQMHLFMDNSEPNPSLNVSQMSDK